MRDKLDMFALAMFALAVICLPFSEALASVVFACAVVVTVVYFKTR